MSEIVILHMAVAEKISFSLLSSGIPLISRLSVENLGASPLRDVAVSLHDGSGFLEDMEFHIEQIEAGSEFYVPVPAVQWDASRAARLTESEQVTLHGEVRVDGLLSVEKDVRLILLPARYWPGVAHAADIASFVCPNDPVIDQILGAAAADLKSRGLDIRLVGYRNSIGDTWRILESVWRMLASKSVTYSLPPVGFEKSGQQVRSHSQVLSSGIGTCLDLAALFAACVEQLGLQAVIVVLNGHAFPACCVRQDLFRSAICKDVAEVRNLVGLRELVPVETALLCGSRPAGLLEACEKAALELASDAAFCCCIDIFQARALGFRPLSCSGDGGVAVDFGPQACMSAPTQRPNPNVPRFGSVHPHVADAGGDPMKERLNRWKLKLLDLSLRNNMLNFKPGKKHIVLDLPDPGLFEDMLAENESFRFVSGGDMVAAEADKFPTKEAASEQIRLMAGKLLAKHQLVSAMAERDLNSTLLEMYRDARLREEETGSPMLYLAFGFLRWRESEGAGAHEAPLVLLPARLERRSIKSNYTLSAGDGEATFNFTLAEKLRRDFAIEDFFRYTDGLPTDAHGLDIDGILDFVASTIKGIRGWEVKRSVGLGIFSFAKYLMWQNLGEKDLIKDCEPIRAILGMKTGIAQGNGSFVEPRQMDRAYHPCDIRTPLPADSSQLSAIVSASSGSSFVLIGPPGTGKSQTIANMIAHCIGSKKTVLFVAEKAAALNVVYKRLKKAGLGSLCLELHSSKARKKEVIEQIRSSFELKPVPFDWQSTGKAYANLRDGLNAYDEALHLRRPNGYTVFEAAGIVSKGADVADVALGIHPSPEDSAEAFALWREAAAGLSKNGESVRFCPGTGLEAVSNAEFSPKWKEELVYLASTLERRIDDVRKCLSKAEEYLPGVSDILKTDGVSKTLDFVHAVDFLAETRTFAAMSGTGDEFFRRMKESATLLRLFREKAADLSAPLAEEVRTDVLACVANGNLRRKWNEASSAFLFSGRKRRMVIDEIRPLYENGAEVDGDRDIPLLERMHTIACSLINRSKGFECISVWKGVNTDPDEVEALLNAAYTVRRAAQTAGTEGNLFAAMRLYDGYLDTDPSTASEIRQARLGVEPAIQNVVEASVSLRACAEGKSRGASEGAEDVQDIDAMLSLCWGILSMGGALHEWCDWNRAVRKAKEVGLQGLVDSILEGSVPVAEAENVFLVNYMRSWLLEATDATPVLCRFTSYKHEQTIDEFKEADGILLNSAVRSIMSAIPDRNELMNRHFSESLILKKQLALKKRHLPVRRLIRELPNLLPQMLPCFLMSPLSVAQYLEWKHRFDVVIFDEASQIPIWDALGALGHGEKVIVVGDPRQLPPTSFFQKLDEEDIEDEPDMESILDQCVACRFPERKLLWHYRSRREGLIAFSNRRYYGGRLLTFPAPDTDDFGVDWHFVADGRYGKGGSRTNVNEARAIVAHVVSLLAAQVKKTVQQSVGIVTFNIQQARLIENLLDAERRKNSAVDRFFSDEHPEPVLVKNLENIQGDERDVMFFSICFARDDFGRISYNFGALNRDGGERRLNVAVTRARQRIHVYSSIQAADIPADRLGGVKDLRDFLDYAEHGPSAFGAMDAGSMGGCESPFEESVVARLEERGWQIRTQVGIAGFRVDIGVVNPDKPGRYLAGVECDGATYHSAATARDRDILRENVLRGLGWEILRVWSTDWWQNQERCLNELDSILRSLLEEFREKASVKDSEASEGDSFDAAQGASLEGSVAGAAGEAFFETDGVGVPDEGSFKGYDANTPGAEFSEDGAAGSIWSGGAESDNLAFAKEAPVRFDAIASCVPGSPAETFSAEVGSLSVGEEPVPVEPLDVEREDVPTEPLPVENEDTPTESLPVENEDTPTESLPAEEDSLTVEPEVEEDVLQEAASGDCDETFSKLNPLIDENWPVREERLFTMYANALGMKRAGSTIRAAAMACLTAYPVTTDTENGARFYWPMGADPSSIRDFPVRRKEKRTVDAICIEELRFIARSLRRPGDDPAKALASRLGLHRLVESTRLRLQFAWDSKEQ